MKPSQWPNWLNQGELDLWAKSSTDKEKKLPGESLACHTWLVLSRLAELARLRPQLAKYLNAPRLWHCLFWACFLHDFGKAARGFQNMLRNTDEKWSRRHEVLSLAFLDWITPSFSDEEQKWMLAAIVSHHKDATEIFLQYRSQRDVIESMVAELDEQVVRGLWRWLSECSSSWMAALELSAFGVQPLTPLPEDQAVRDVREMGASRIKDWLETYDSCLSAWKRARHAPIVPTLVMLRGLTTTADHAASAHLKKISPGIQGSWEELDEQIKVVLWRERQKSGQNASKPIETYEHQRACAAQHQSSALLIAPTGSGKTEAALFWALGNGSTPTPRLFYTLPYQASMNAMHQRLSLPHYFGEKSVGLQHGRASQTLYRRLLDAEEGALSAVEQTRWLLNLNKLHAYPIKVFSPYQMLKVLYQIKGFEGMLADYTQATFIFDEIHAYDASRLALILALVKHLRERYGARFLIMSATFPSLLQDIMPSILGIREPIRAEKALFQNFRRHRLKLLDGDLLEQGLTPILEDIHQKKSVLVCCNTVQRAQDMRKLLLHHLAPEQVELLHSRFTMKDRLAHENAVITRCASGTSSQAIAVVATQVVEVSLNIDLNTIYTDPAPLDALVQRFGRVNRARLKEIVPVHVFREPRDGQGIYLEQLVQRTLDQLEQHDGDEIDEAAIEGWLDAIYNASEIRDPWIRTYEKRFRLAEQLLRDLRPFDSDKEREKQFEELFDGVEVLPSCFEVQYLEHRGKSEFLEASQLFVPISYKKCQYLKSQGKIQVLDEKTDRRWIAKLPYNCTLGLLFDATAEMLGDEF
jgi:CRISPR-associated endonuclease/helicase Cas3